MNAHRWILLTMGAALLSFVALNNASSQPGDDKDDLPPPPCQTFVGALEGGPASARIGIVVEKGSFLIYLCSQDQKFNQSFSRWLKGKIGDGGAIEAASADGIKVSGAVKNDTVEGAVAGPDGAALKFTAKQVAACANAGLYRAAEIVEDDEQLAGWVVDAKDEIAGAVLNKKKGTITLPNPKQSKGNNLTGPGGNVNAQKVSSALNPPNGTKGKNPLGKIDPATRAEILQDLNVRFQKTGGSPLQGAFVNLIRRAQAGAKGTDPTDEKLLSIVRKINPKTRADYLKNWDGLPQALRSRLLGSSADLATGKGSLNLAGLNAIAQRLPKRGGVKATPIVKGSVKSVQIRQLVCVDETNPEFIGSDEIFVIYSVIQGQTVFNPQQTKIYTGLDTGKTAQFTGADVTVFPPPGQQPAQGDIEISASIFEDDSADQAKIAELVKAAAEAGVEILKATGKDKAADVAKALEDFFDSVVAAFSSTQFLGSDTLVARPNGQLVSLNGQPKSSMTVQRFRNGNRVYRYDLKNIQAFQ